MYHRDWDGPSWSADWENLGVGFGSNPAAVSWGKDRLDVFALGTHSDMSHYAFDGSPWTLDALGGVFNSAPVAASWASGRLDVSTSLASAQIMLCTTRLTMKKVGRQIGILSAAILRVV